MKEPLEGTSLQHKAECLPVPLARMLWSVRGACCLLRFTSFDLQGLRFPLPSASIFSCAGHLSCSVFDHLPTEHGQLDVLFLDPRTTVLQLPVQLQPCGHCLVVLRIQWKVVWVATKEPNVELP